MRSFMVRTTTVTHQEFLMIVERLASLKQSTSIGGLSYPLRANHRFLSSVPVYIHVVVGTHSLGISRLTQDNADAFSVVHGIPKINIRTFKKCLQIQ